MLQYDNSKQSSITNILVIGDVMVDRYWLGTPQALAEEASVAVLAVDSTEDRAGGAANVALNIRKLGGQVAILAPLGQDQDGVALGEILTAAGIEQYWQYSSRTSTITKHRMLSNKQQLVRVDFEQRSCPIELNAHTKSKIANHSVIVCSDYNKGALDKCAEIITYAKSLGKIVLVDPKGKDFSKYHNATMLTPNYKEFTEVVGEIESNNKTLFHSKAFQLIHKLELDYLLVTCGADGMALFDVNNFCYTASSYANQVYDVTGAGDTVLASLAVSLVNHEDKIAAVERASHAAAVVVSKVGTGYATKEEVDLQVAQSISKNTNNNPKRQHHIIYNWPMNIDRLRIDEINELTKLKKQRTDRLIVNLDMNKYNSTNSVHTFEQLAYMISKISIVDSVIHS
ncbi:MAG: bifunctional hydroxymethylpyrimidine kinase/phosphomethylpyrimidine kinase [Gammaproteobacteria bacterium]|nr:bifunctional hydroxymethylpyrimidine kinase/phosphomethylpyrimidine kinase [Gammaproteobacteria bacterium]